MWEALVLLFGVFAGTFGGVVSAAAVMAISPNEDNPDRDASSSVAEYVSNVARLNVFRRVDNRGPLRVRLRLYAVAFVFARIMIEKAQSLPAHASSSGHGRSTWLISYCFVIYIVEIGYLSQRYNMRLSVRQHCSRRRAIHRPMWARQSPGRGRLPSIQEGLQVGR